MDSTESKQEANGTSKGRTGASEQSLEGISLVSLKAMAPGNPVPGNKAAPVSGQNPASSRPVSAGSPSPLGATPTETGVNFAVASRNAQEIRLVLFGAENGPAMETIKLEHRTGHVWHIHVEGLGKGQLYGYQASGPYAPGDGLRFNPHKLLLDPYAKALSGQFENTDNLLLGYDGQCEEKDLKMDTRDNAHIVPKAIVWDDAFDWGEDKRPGIPEEKRVIYEVHVKGFTAHPSSGVEHAGTYLGFIGKIPYLKELGVNAVELLPIHAFVCEDFLKEKGLSNYWGYNTIGFFAPESSYATGAYPGCAVDEFKTLVRELHKAGIEVILDVVYNHTAEGNEQGATLSFKGLDNPSYYSLSGEGDAPRRYYKNFSGTGNTLNAGSPDVQRLVLDSLHYWAEVMHVDGFRFDLAACLGRDHTGAFDACGHLLGAISDDPVLNKLKLIAEPWDMEAYEVGSLPRGWSEWNGKFRDCFRKFAKGDAGQVPEIGSRIAGSPDLFGHNGRGASDSINFLTCHDGFTLYDLVSYDGKHNEPNLEDNRDGADDNNSWNCGAEGETEDEEINRLRRRQAKNFFCYQMFSIGTPMITAGDEFLRTQNGNNNVYAQDNAISWLDWDRCARNADLGTFVKGLLRFRAAHPVLQRPRFLAGEDKSGDGVPDIHWFGPGEGDVHWDDPEQRCLGFQVDGGEVEASEEKDGKQPGKDAYRLFIVFNADAEAHPFKLPGLEAGRRWHRVVDTSLAAGEDFRDADQEILIQDGEYLVGPRSSIVLKSRTA